VINVDTVKYVGVQGGVTEVQHQQGVELGRILMMCQCMIELKLATKIWLTLVAGHQNVLNIAKTRSVTLFLRLLLPLSLCLKKVYKMPSQFSKRNCTKSKRKSMAQLLQVSRFKLFQISAQYYLGNVQILYHMTFFMSNFIPFPHMMVF